MAGLGLSEWLAAGRALARRNLLRYGGNRTLTEDFEKRFATYLKARHVRRPDRLPRRGRRWTRR
jgi:hypothetical protein